MIATIGTSDRPCWLAEACKISSSSSECVCGKHSRGRRPSAKRKLDDAVITTAMPFPDALMHWVT